MVLLHIHSHSSHLQVGVSSASFFIKIGKFGDTHEGFKYFGPLGEYLYGCDVYFSSDGSMKLIPDDPRLGIVLREGDVERLEEILKVWKDVIAEKK